jgi:protein-S-isoprenylcysteine O-methyltransferase Ste14
MLLRDNLEMVGQWLFRWRSYLPLLLIGLVPVGLRGYEHPWRSPGLDFMWELLCFSIAAFGLGIRVKTAGHVPAGTSGRNMQRQAAEELNTTGMYSIVRNPLYLGPALVPRVWWLPLLLAVAFVFYYERIVFAEEQFLERKFGQHYRDWADRTPAFLLHWRNWTPPALPFSVRTALKREYLGCCGMVALFIVVELAENLVLYGMLKLDLFWQVVGLFGLSTFIVVRFLCKATRLLLVPGR